MSSYPHYYQHFMDLKQPPTSIIQRLNQLLSTIKKELLYALSFLSLLISSIIILSFLHYFQPQFLLRFGLVKATPQTCDAEGYSRGRWVRVEDETFRPWYDETCPFLDPGFRCKQNGRLDGDYIKWRWQPQGCDLPRFNASKLLESTRNGRIVFAGDSIGRNQWESLVCMLSQAVSNKSTIYEENGNPITKHKGYLSIRFGEYNLTVEYYRDPFLVAIGRPPPNSLEQVHSTIRVDELHWFSKKWVGANVLIFSAGHWWNKDKTMNMGTYFQEKGKINFTMDVMEAFRRSLQTWKLWVMENMDLERTHVVFRSYSPVHYSHGEWNEGGQCNISTEPESDYRKIEAEPINNLYISEVMNELAEKNRKVRYLNITFLSGIRKDGHPSIHREPGTPPDAPQDCSHWCLPGIPDTWNELLYVSLLSTGYMN